VFLLTAKANHTEQRTETRKQPLGGRCKDGLHQTHRRFPLVFGKLTSAVELSHSWERYYTIVFSLISTKDFFYNYCIHYSQGVMNQVLSLSTDPSPSSAKLCLFLSLLVYRQSSLKVLSSHSNWGVRLDSFNPMLKSRCPAI
jgi:hypothetical protein